VVQVGISLAGWTVAQAYDGTGYFHFRYGHSGFSYNPQVGQLINIQGVVYTRGGQYVIVPRNDNDVEIQTISINIAYALDRNTVRLIYTRDISQISNVLNPSTYTFTPVLTINSVAADPENTKGVIISTSNQVDGQLYKLVANNGSSLHDSTKFFGGFMQISKVQSTFKSSANPDTQSMFLSAYMDSAFLMTMTGVITGAGNRFPSYWWFMQSSNAPFSGITIWNGNSPWWNATEGDSVIVVGLIEEFQGLTEIAQIKYYKIVSNNNNYLPAKVKVRQLAYSNDTSEYYESMLIKLDSAVVVDTGTTAFFLVADYSNYNDPSAPRVQVQKINLGPYVPQVGDMLNITGNFRRWRPSAGIYNSRIYPRFQTDIEFITTSIVEKKEAIKFTIKGNTISFILPNDKDYGLDIYSIDGRKALSKVVNSKNSQVVLNLKKGIYLMKLDGKSYKIIIN
ncbi:MAG: T9SS type A sorting domain-containing protein, partial [candidate division WOR-3 bacterium]|nr:T9SS type A sorting domain-containing protein [candidate division WOR-3 bacterium]MDW8150318.1 T9SS type A sorting domain-containing protein [candidate division WOR-3 bacterium]